jgi:hypothetical protein
MTTMNASLWRRYAKRMETGVKMTSTEPQKIVASEITIVDRDGKPRIRLLVEEDGSPAIHLIDKAEKLRVALYLKDDEDWDSEAGLLITNSNRAATIRLWVGHDALTERRASLDIVEGIGIGRRVHKFPARPRNASD